MFIFNFIQRSFLYHSLILYGVLHLIDSYKFYNSFYSQFYNLLLDLHINNTFKFLLQKIYPVREISFKVYNITLIVFGGLCILNIPYFKVFRLIGGVSMILTSLIVYNPIKDIKTMLEQSTFSDIIDKLPNTEFVLMLLIGVAMICHYIKNEEEEEDSDEGMFENINEDEENKKNIKKKKENKNKKNKRKIS